eukprot:gene10413-5842_t
MNALFYKDDPRTKMLKTDSNQFACVPCAKLINMDEAHKHLTAPAHEKSVKVQEMIITQKLAPLGFSPTHLFEAMRGKHIDFPVVSQMKEVAQSVDKVVDDLHLEAHFRFQLEKTVKQQEQKLKEQAQALKEQAVVQEKHHGEQKQALEWLRGTMQTKATREEVRNLGEWARFHFKAQEGDQDHLHALAEMWDRHDEMWKVLHARRARKGEVAMARRPASKNRGQVDMSVCEC